MGNDDLDVQPCGNGDDHVDHDIGLFIFHGNSIARYRFVGLNVVDTVSEAGSDVDVCGRFNLDTCQVAHEHGDDVAPKVMIERGGARIVSKAIDVVIKILEVLE